MALHPKSATGPNLPHNFQPVREVDIFKLFLTPIIVDSIVEATNSYAWHHATEGGSKYQYFFSALGDWEDTTREEMYVLFSMILYMALVKMPSFWRTNGKCLHLFMVLGLGISSRPIVGFLH